MKITKICCVILGISAAVSAWGQSTCFINGDDLYFVVNGAHFNMKYVEGGTFRMGDSMENPSDDSRVTPPRNVTLSDYWIGEAEVTQELWQAVMGYNPSNFTGNNQLPVETVSYDDCLTFISKLNTLTGKTFRLPTEAEWEFAARGGKNSRGYEYSGSNNICDVAWYQGNSRGTHPVKTKRANELGIYDMCGNVSEWCYDWELRYYYGSDINPMGPAFGSYRMHRGGNWNYGDGWCSVTYRDCNSPGKHLYEIGFRLAIGEMESWPDNSNVAGDLFTVNGAQFKMIRVNGGTFRMGARGSSVESSSSSPHNVTLSDYWIGETEVTQELWQAVMGSNPSKFTGDARRPVDNVSYEDCLAFIRKLNSLTGRTFRLPTEAEWEFAARGGNKSRGYMYSGGNEVGIVAWTGYNSGGTTCPVKTKRANELGIYDMSGNVFEWCNDWHGNYGTASVSNPKGPANGTYRVTRGGYWGATQLVIGCAVYHRSRTEPSKTSENIGFRLAL